MQRRASRPGVEPPQDDGEQGYVPSGGQPRAAPRTLESDTHPVIVMEETIDRLKLLNYETKFCKAKGFEPLTSTFFAFPASNLNHQFHYFTSLVAWLLTSAGQSFPAPGQFDDPNATISRILQEIRATGMQLDVAPAKLKQGNGDGVCAVLRALVDYVLQATRFQFKSPVIPTENLQEMPHVDTDVDEFGVEEDVQEAEDDDYGAVSAQEAVSAEDDLNTSLIEATVDAAEWLLELERVGPRLKYTIPNDGKEWRAHVETMTSHKATIGSKFTEMDTQLKAVAEDVRKAIEALQSREKTIGTASHMSALIEHHRNMQDNAKDLAERLNQAMEARDKLTAELAQYTEDLETIKNTMEERGGKMTDASPVVQVRQALQNMRDEIQTMEVRIGVVQHTLFQIRAKPKIGMRPVSGVSLAA